jgi:hypothetical protein
METVTRSPAYRRLMPNGSRRALQVLVADIVAGAFARSSHRGAPIEPALLLCLDGAANIAPLPNLDEVASTAGQSVQLLTVLQNPSQAADGQGGCAPTRVAFRFGRATMCRAERRRPQAGELATVSRLAHRRCEVLDLDETD